MDRLGKLDGPLASTPLGPSRSKRPRPSGAARHSPYGRRSAPASPSSSCSSSRSRSSSSPASSSGSSPLRRARAAILNKRSKSKTAANSALRASQAAAHLVPGSCELPSPFSSRAASSSSSSSNRASQAVAHLVTGPRPAAAAAPAPAPAPSSPPVSPTIPALLEAFFTAAPLSADEPSSEPTSQPQPQPQPPLPLITLQAPAQAEAEELVDVSMAERTLPQPPAIRLQPGSQLPLPLQAPLVPMARPWAAPTARVSHVREDSGELTLADLMTPWERAQVAAGHRLEDLDGLEPRRWRRFAFATPPRARASYEASYTAVPSQPLTAWDILMQMQGAGSARQQQQQQKCDVGDDSGELSIGQLMTPWERKQVAAGYALEGLTDSCRALAFRRCRVSHPRRCLRPSQHPRQRQRQRQRPHSHQRRIRLLLAAPRLPARLGFSLLLPFREAPLALVLPFAAPRLLAQLGLLLLRPVHRPWSLRWLARRMPLDHSSCRRPRLQLPRHSPLTIARSSPAEDGETLRL